MSKLKLDMTGRKRGGTVQHKQKYSQGIAKILSNQLEKTARMRR